MLVKREEECIASKKRAGNGTVSLRPILTVSINT